MKKVRDGTVPRFKDYKIMTPVGLEIENLVFNHHGELHRIRHTDFSRFIHPDMGHDYGLYAIPLSQDILWEMGFRRRKCKEDEDEYLQLSTFLIKYDEDDEDWMVCNIPIDAEMDESNYLTTIDYVHQLQNLYYHVEHSPIVFELDKSHVKHFV